ncbi:MAG: DUF368 domain-containing protein [Endozoicomonadaceae bacterium]|nr:DUF368 domain-containing protein [Endozoicomonadaceae bacterium]
MLLLEIVILFLKGALMGAADVVPGVSGGTIAFIVGIYDRLLNSLKTLGPASVSILFRQGVASFWRYIDGTFLAAVLSGVLFSIFTMARLITYGLEVWPILVWSFFFGLVVVSALLILRHITDWNLARFLCFVVGIIVAVFIGYISPRGAVQPEWYTFLWAGALTICAMILPGISGSFILLLLGLYIPVMQAVIDFDIATLLIFVVGCVSGLLLFSRFLSWLLIHCRFSTLAFLVGSMVGSVEKIWPWKQTLSWEPLPINVLPWNYESLTGQSSDLWEALGLMLLAVVLVSVFEWYGRSKAQINESD